MNAGCATGPVHGQAWSKVRLFYSGPGERFSALPLVEESLEEEIVS